jgi:hypothetical protein
MRKKRKDKKRKEEGEQGKQSRREIIFVPGHNPPGKKNICTGWDTR